MVITLTKSTVSNWLAHVKLLNDHVDPTGAVVRTSYINWAEGFSGSILSQVSLGCVFEQVTFLQLLW